jgi:hypothetical protein
VNDDDAAATDSGEVRLRWEAPELVVVAILVATAILIVAGVVAGFVIGTSTEQPGTGSLVALATQYATETWAGVVTAVLMLGSLGVCWWQQGVRLDTAESAPNEARAGIARARRLAVLAMTGLLLAILGSVASLVGRLDAVQSFGSQTVAAVWVPGIAEILGTVALAIAGLLIGGRIIGPRHRGATGYDDPDDG